jgi:hypothetical protein
MGRQHTFMDREFGRRAYDPGDHGTFVPNTVFVIMPFSSNESEQRYIAIRRACSTLDLRAVRADEGRGSGFIIKDIIALIV